MVLFKIKLKQKLTFEKILFGGILPSESTKIESSVK